jgi:histidinol-phosphate/aromatic aminotransferase/cobyric acid decarboxylase-like protein
MPEHLRVTVGTPAQNERFLAALESALVEALPGPGPASR